MDRYKFNDEINKTIVNSILQGYKNYINERIEKANKMRISNAYAWVKGNHIDDVAAGQIESIGGNYHKQRAGGSWEYFEFELEDKIDNEKYIFIFKSKASINRTKGAEIKIKSEYIKNYGEINKAIIQNELMPNYTQKGQIVLEDMPSIRLSGNKFKTDEQQELREGINRVYLIVYDVDKSTNMIESVESYLPSSDGKLFEIDNLSEYLNQTSIEFTEEEKKFAKNKKNIFNEEAEDEDKYSFEVLSKEKRNH